MEIAKICEKAGAKAIAVHGRTRAQVYSGKADWDIIKAVREAVKIPVIGNGDITSPEIAKRMLDETGCQAIMIGRGVLGRPWLVRQVQEYLETGTYEERVSLQERRQIIFRHLQRLKESKGEKLAVLEMRSHGAWYLKGLKNASDIKVQLSAAQSISDFSKIIQTYFSYLETLGN